MESVFGNVSVKMDVCVDLCDIHAYWHTENIPLFIPALPHSAHYPDWRQRTMGKVRGHLLVFIPLKLHKSAVCILHQTLTFCSFVEAKQLFLLHICLEILRRAADKKLTGHTLRTMELYILRIIKKAKGGFTRLALSLFQEHCVFWVQVDLLY